MSMFTKNFKKSATSFGELNQKPYLCTRFRCYSSVVERILGKDEVPSSTLGSSSKARRCPHLVISFFLLFSAQKKELSPPLFSIEQRGDSSYIFVSLKHKIERLFLSSAHHAATTRTFLLNSLVYLYTSQFGVN